MSRAYPSRSRCSTTTALVALLALAGCSRTKVAEPSAPVGEADVQVVGTCAPTAPVGQALAAPLEVLPTTLGGTLCGATDRLWVPFDGASDDASRPVVRARLVGGSAAGPYKITLFGVDQGKLEPLRTELETHVFTLPEGAPELTFAVRDNTFTESTVVLQLEGPAGPAKLELDRPELAPYMNCTGAYEPLPPETLPRVLPTLLEAELCNIRDSRVWALEVVAGRAVTITLENPLAIDRFELGAYSSGIDGSEPLPVTAGVTQATLGLLAQRKLSFTPERSGKVSLYVGLGASRGESARLRVEQ